MRLQGTAKPLLLLALLLVLLLLVQEWPNSQVMCMCLLCRNGSCALPGEDWAGCLQACFKTQRRPGVQVLALRTPCILPLLLLPLLRLGC